jgi:hypothetical protein
MRSRMAVAAFIAAFCGAAAARAGEARVEFVAPERFTDASVTGDHRIGPEEPTLRELADHLRHLAQHGLPEGQLLDVQVTDIDLAGRYDPLRLGARDTRIVRGVDWPRITLRYSLRAGDRVLGAGDEVLQDQAFEFRAGRSQPGGRLFFEKAMLDDWFQKRFPRQG